MFKTIIENKGNGILCLYPSVFSEPCSSNKVTHEAHKLETRKYTTEEINTIKLKLKKLYNNIKISNITQTETFYKDLIKVDIKYTTTNNTFFVKKENSHILFENNLLITSNIIKINEIQFPSLVKYDHNV